MKETVEKILNEKMAGTGMFLVELNMVKNRIEIYADSDSGISIDECAALNRHLHRRLEEMNIDAGNYIVEISSPGIDRNLADARSFKKNVGRNLKVRNSQNKYISGKLALVSEEGLVLMTPAKKKELIKYTDIKEAKAAI